MKHMSNLEKVSVTSLKFIPIEKPHQLTYEYQKRALHWEEFLEWTLHPIITYSNDSVAINLALTEHLLDLEDHTGIFMDEILTTTTLENVSNYWKSREFLLPEEEDKIRTSILRIDKDFLQNPYYRAGKIISHCIYHFQGDTFTKLTRFDKQTPTQQETTH